MALRGDTAFVSDTRRNNDVGAVEVFEYDGSTWSNTQTLTATNGAQNDDFGYALAADGDTLLIGTGAGDRAFVFTEDIGGTWVQQTTLQAPNREIYFSWTLDLEGDTALIGNYSATSGDDGRAYVFERSGSSWSKAATLAPPTSFAYAKFGYSVALDGGRALVGQPQTDAGNDPVGPGAAYLYTDGSSGWSRSATLTASDGTTADEFGATVELDGATAIVSSPTDDPGPAYTFVDDGGWSQQQKVTGLSLRNEAAIDLGEDTALIAGESLGVYER